MKDIESVEKRLHSVEKLKRVGMRRVLAYEVLEKVMKGLNDDIAIDMNLNDEKQN